jgi:D-sedoheptulose 7-phosphate isomerase
MHYPQRYRAELVNALQSIDVQAVEEVVRIFQDAQAHGRCIFVCGNGTNAIASSHLLCDMLRASNINRTSKFRIFALTDELRDPGASADGFLDDRVLADHLRKIASPGDVVVGISVSGNSPSVLRVFEYAREIECRTICISTRSGGKLAYLSDTAILIPAAELGSVEDAQMIVCRMIGNYFVNFDQGA